MGDEDGLDYGFDSYLSQVPEALRDQIKPAFEEYGKQIKSKVDSQYGALDPYKSFADQGWEPEHVNVGLQLLQMAQENPQQIIQGLLQEHPELATQFATPAAPVVPAITPGTNTDYGDLPPALIERMDQQEQIIQLLYQGQQQNQQQTIAQQQAAQDAIELQQFQKTLDQVAPTDKYPRQYILAHVAQGKSPEEAVAEYTAWETSRFQQQNAGLTPLVAPASGGGLPSEVIDTAKLTSEQRKSLITQYLTRANQQG